RRLEVVAICRGCAALVTWQARQIDDYQGARRRARRFQPHSKDAEGIPRKLPRRSCRRRPPTRGWQAPHRCLAVKSLPSVLWQIGSSLQPRLLDGTTPATNVRLDAK